MPLRISEEEREAIRVGTTGGRVLESAYWRSPAHRDDPDLHLKYLHDKARFSGLNGQRAALRSAIAETKAFIKELRSKPPAFRGSRMDIVNCVADLLQFSEAGQDLLRFVPVQNLTPRRNATAARLKAFETTFEDMIRPAAVYLDDAGGADTIARADLGVVIRFADLAGETAEDSNMYLTRYKTMESAFRLGQNAGLRVVAIPDYLFGVLDDRPAHVLSFHTAGQFPGFTHFKRGDLQTFMILDRGGYSGWSTLSGSKISDLELPSFEDAEAICNRFWTDIVLANVSAYEQEDLQAAADPLPD